MHLWSVSYHKTYVSHIKSEDSFPERHVTIKSILWETWEWRAGVKLQYGTAGAHWLDFSSFAFPCLIPPLSYRSLCWLCSVSQSCNHQLFKQSITLSISSFNKLIHCIQFTSTPMLCFKYIKAYEHESIMIILIALNHYSI